MFPAVVLVVCASDPRVALVLEVSGSGTELTRCSDVDKDDGDDEEVVVVETVWLFGRR